MGLGQKGSFKNVVYWMKISMSCLRFLATNSRLKGHFVKWYCFSLYRVLIIWTEKLMKRWLITRIPSKWFDFVVYLRWFLKVTLRIPTAHDFRVIRAHSRARAYTTSRVFLQVQHYSEVNACFLYSFLLNNFGVQIILLSWKWKQRYS